MRTLSLILGGLFLVGCQEYEIHGDPDVYGEPNPPDLSTPVVTDRVVQVTVPSVDVLFVIDNSGSMIEEQDALKASFAKFMNYFMGSGLDWHVGVVSTDMVDNSHRGRLREADGVRYLDSSSATPVETFKKMASMGTDGSWDEKGRAAAWAALVLLNDSYNAGFYRDEANLSIVVISDEDDVSGTTPVSKAEFISWLQTHKSREGMTSFSSIVGDVPSGCTGPGGDAYPGREYVDTTNAVGGIFHSICDANWDSVLAELGMQAAGLKREFYLSEVPVEDTIDVWVDVDGEEHYFTAGSDYTYSRSRNSITFSEYVPPELAEVYIEYEILAAWQPPEDGGGDTGE